MVAAIQNGDQKEKRLIIYGGYSLEDKMPLRDGYAYVLSDGRIVKLSDLP